MSLNLLEYDTLRRIRTATESIAENSVNTVSLDRFMQLDGVCRGLAAIARKMEQQGKKWFDEYHAMADNRDAFREYAERIKKEAEDRLAALQARAERAEAELAALKASRAQGGQG